MISSRGALSRACGQATRLRPLVLAVLLAACQPTDLDLMPSAPAVSSPAGPLAQPIALGNTSNRPVTLSSGGSANRAMAAPEVVTGTGTFVDTGVPSRRAQPAFTGSDVTLDFANVDVRDVLKSVLGELLHVSYTVDPAVQGNVTLQTGGPVPRSAVVNVLTSALQLSGVALVVRDGLYFAIPVANATRQAPLGGTAGFVTQVVTPQYVAATDLERVLEPMMPPGTTMKSDPARNLLIVSGAARDVAAVMDNIATFDIDALRGVSFALLPLRNGRAKDIVNEVSNLLTSAGRSMADTVKIMPIERMNAVLITSMQPLYLQRVRSWVERLDRGDGRADQQLFVYRVQNGRAADIARVLRQALGLAGDAGPGGPPEAAGPAGAPPGPVTGLATPTPIDNLLSRSANAPGGGAPPGRADRNEPLAGVAAAAALATGGRPPTSEIRVTPDQTNNAVIVTGSAQDYAPIEAALQKLDIPPLQVLIDATVAEVTLQNDLSYGLQYFFKSGKFTDIFGPNVAPIGGSVVPATLASTFPGFGFLSGANFGLTQGSNNFVLQALSKLSNVRVLSSPNLLVLNNGSARLQVGDQVPIATQSATSTLTNTAQTVNSIDYRDTGIILNVTPRVNASGLVLLDISEEVSQANKTGTSALDSPTISQRRVTSSVAVNDGQTIGLAGLIQDKRDNGSSGLPWLQDIPGLGLLFSARTQSDVRTELLVLITPRVIRSREEGDAVTRELRDKLRLTIPVVRRR
jgi:general secretion pathway protein D